MLTFILDNFRLNILSVFLCIVLFSCNDFSSKNSKISSNSTSDFDKDTTLINHQLESILKSNLHNDSNLNKLNNLKEKCIKINYNYGIAKSYFLEGELFYKKNEYQKALSSFEESKKISVRLKDKISEANCLERLASINLATTDPNLALKLYYESLIIYENLNNEKGIAKIYNILGIYQLGKRKFSKAESYLLESLNIHQKIKDTNNIIENLGNLGYLYECKGDFKKAELIYIQLITKLELMNEKISLPVIYYNYASLLQKQNKNIEAIIKLRKAINISESEAV